MKCNNCGYENKDGNFCEKCGNPLEEAVNTNESSENITENELQTPTATAKTDGIDEDFLKSLGELAEYSEPNTDTVNNLSDEITETAEKNIGENNRESDYDIGNQAEDESRYDIEPDMSFEQAENDPIAKEALENLKKYEEGTITHPNEKSKKKKGKFYCPKNPMLWSFLWLLLFGLVLGTLSIFFFNVDLDGTQIVFGIAFSVFTAAVLGINFVYYFPAALTLDKLLKGKGVRLEYKLKNYELVDLAEEAKKKNRGFYLAISLFGLAFTIYYIYILATAMVKTNLMWISLYFSIGVFAVFALLFFIMPKFNYERMMQNGERVIVGNKSVYYGGTYYHWRGIKPEATFGTLSTKKHRLDITFVQEQKDGTSKRRKVEMYAPDSALKEITRLLGEYEEASRKYREKQQK